MGKISKINNRRRHIERVSISQACGATEGRDPCWCRSSLTFIPHIHHNGTENTTDKYCTV